MDRRTSEPVDARHTTRGCKEPSEIYLHADNFTNGGLGEGTLPFAIFDGHFVHLSALSPGEHVVEFRGEICGMYPLSTSAATPARYGG